MPKKQPTYASQGELFTPRVPSVWDNCKQPPCKLCGSDRKDWRTYDGLVEGNVHETCAAELDVMIREHGFWNVYAKLRELDDEKN